MSITFGFFNSVDGDRVYNADDFNSCIDAIASDGIFKRNGGGTITFTNAISSRTIVCVVTKIVF